MTILVPPRLLVATANAGKVREIALLLVNLPLEVVGLDVVPDMPELPEPHATFAGNATSKAVAAAAHVGCLALADDSGLEVPALGGRPGVYSSRYAPSDPERIARLLNELRDLRGEQRRARFRCMIALADPTGSRGLWEGTVEGSIATAPRGRQGFGFDPVFLYGDQTFAEMSPDEKGRVSHRGEALRAFVRDLPGCLDELS
jgi:XTP/dITP diphosphohydrolase